MSIYYNNIKIAFRKAKEELAYYDLQELLSENQSYLCSEYRPEFSDSLGHTLETLSNETNVVILDALDTFWLFILNQYVKTME